MKQTYIFWISLREILTLEGRRSIVLLSDMHPFFEKIKRVSGGAALGVGMVLIPQIMGPQGQVQAPTAPLVVCPKCHAYVPATSKFCPQCGNPLKPPLAAAIICPRCGNWIPSSSKFCPQCGIQLAQRTPKPLQH